ncbi:PDR/VanB family oxidoreductase [Rhizobium leguminosarum]|uniref:PDR/VanB family oxidoreductase n=1 Tax=Rhizobium leguminosarum TaxID=384 RepID=UPI001C94FF9E|nr:PDR/VanB family oxidoreductase [Rhizobium leguminosarum]MBY5610153.1 oxidoreductase [Rhizobium leguminosarum]MBY5614748.1 oxidoreductase [Rhizobium leguminosarum]MBY5655854.1 oxidoreductase [Rhizobium leguminosarum]
MSGGTEIPVRVARITPIAERVKRFRFERLDGKAMPYFSGGAHVIVLMNDDGHMRRNAYSLMSPPHDCTAYEISVLHVEDSRGGSTFMHEKLSEGDELKVSYPVNLFQPDWRGRKHLLIAGGIGITPFIAMMEQFSREGANFELHYAIRTRDRGAYWQQLVERYGGHRIKIYCDAEGGAIPLTRLLGTQPLGTHLYVCGPSGMIDGVLKAGLDAGWPEQNLHSERFLSSLPGKPFAIELLRSGKTVKVGHHESMLEAIEAAGVDAPFLCRGGACGQCETGVVTCDGKLLHHDVYLTNEEKASGRKVMICVSRFEGNTLHLDL